MAPGEDARRGRMVQWRPWHRLVGRENGDYTLEVALPGVASGGVHIVHDHGQLVITGKRAGLPTGCRSLSGSRELVTFPDYRLVLRLPCAVEVGGIQAEMEEGMLTMVLPVQKGAREANGGQISLE